MDNGRHPKIAKLHPMIGSMGLVYLPTFGLPYMDPMGIGFEKFDPQFFWGAENHPKSLKAPDHTP